MHWSRWGDPAMESPLAAQTRELVDAFIGTRETETVDPGDVRLGPALGDALVRGMVAIVGGEHVLTDHEHRLLRTRGKATPDLLAMRSGDGSDAPGAVVRPGDAGEVQRLLEWAVRERVAVVPFGGGTSVVGGLVADRDDFEGVISLDLIRLNRLLSVDTESMTATLEPGLRGPEAEALLGEHGLTIGHFPQSFEYASIGGFAVTRSSGQSSSGYGRFDSLVVGMDVATPAGRLTLGQSPSNAVGPDLRQWILGSEGAFGVVTSVTVRVRHVPQARVYEHWTFDSFASGAAAMRTLAQAPLLPTVLRLSDEAETSINLANPAEVGGSTEGGCLMVVGYEGTPEAVAARRTAVTAVLTSAGGVSSGEDEGWSSGRFHGPYLRDQLLDVGVLVETLETVAFWSRLRQTYDAVKGALAEALPGSLVLCHISHVYETGASLYFTVAAPETDDPITQWREAKAKASDAIIASGASITHHHAVGRDHQPWLAAEIGPLGIEMLQAVKRALDPTGIMNPGVLIPRF